MTLAPQGHEEAVPQSGRQVRGGDDHCVRAHSVKKIHHLQPVEDQSACVETAADSTQR